MSALDVGGICVPPVRDPRSCAVFSFPKDLKSLDIILLSLFLIHPFSFHLTQKIKHCDREERRCLWPHLPVGSARRQAGQPATETRHNATAIYTVTCPVLITKEQGRQQQEYNTQSQLSMTGDSSFSFFLLLTLSLSYSRYASYTYALCAKEFLHTNKRLLFVYYRHAAMR